MSNQKSRLFGSALKAAARAEAATARTAAFRMLAKERGGVNDRTRAGIIAESREAGRHAAIAVYLRNGYTLCQQPIAEWYPDENQWMPSPCENLVGPGFHECPSCAEDARKGTNYVFVR